MTKHICMMKLKFYRLKNTIKCFLNSFFTGATRSTELTITRNYKGFNRNIRPTLEHKFKPDIEHLLNENQENISKLEYVNRIKNLHTTDLQNFLTKNSKLLDRILPTLSPNESKLDRKLNSPRQLAPQA